MVNNQRIGASKQFLSVKSRVFRELFKTNDGFDKSEQTVVPIEDTTFKSFKSFINSLYCDQLVIEDNEDLQLIEDIQVLAIEIQVFIDLSVD